MRLSLASFALAAAIFLPSLASADEASPWIAPIITPITKGSAAPFSGVLLTPEAVARIVAEAKDCPKRVVVEAERARGEQKAVDDKTLADARADAKRDREVLQAGIDQRDGGIKDLTTRLEKAEQAKGNAWLWAGAGVLAGAVITTLSIMAVNLAK